MNWWKIYSSRTLLAWSWISVFKSRFLICSPYYFFMHCSFKWTHYSSLEWNSALSLERHGQISFLKSYNPFFILDLTISRSDRSIQTKTRARNGEQETETLLSVASCVSLCFCFSDPRMWKMSFSFRSSCRESTRGVCVWTAFKTFLKVLKQLKLCSHIDTCSLLIFTSRGFCDYILAAA